MGIIHCRYGRPFWYLICTCYYVCAVTAASDKADPHGGGDRIWPGKDNEQRLEESAGGSSPSTGCTVVMNPSMAQEATETAASSASLPTSSEGNTKKQPENTGIPTGRPRRGLLGFLRSLVGWMKAKHWCYLVVLAGLGAAIYTLELTGRRFAMLVASALYSVAVIAIFLVEIISQFFR